jgi:hypothetical protein
MAGGLGGWVGGSVALLLAVEPKIYISYKEMGFLYSTNFKSFSQIRQNKIQ